MGTRTGWGRHAAGLAAGLALGAAVAPADAQSRWLPRLQWENDGFNFWIHPAHRPDEEYTNGLRIAMDAYGAPWWGRRFGKDRPDCAADADDTGACLTTTLTLAQEMYTPHLARVPFSTPDWERERPYFGWLYLAGEGHVVTRRALRTFGLTLGVTGPPSGAQVLHAAAHLVNRRFARTVSGWETQVGFEPGVIASYRHTVMALHLGSRRAAMVQVMPSAGVSLGNVQTGADVGGLARVGLNLTHPWDPRNWTDRRPLELWVQAGGKLEYVARDMSLDGTLVNPGRRVVRIPGVQEVEYGAGVRFFGLSLAYRVVTRGQEYLTGPRRHTYSSLSTAVTVVP
ncbi:MAG TPA: lipid A deacylase LpxR family protein [Gemmatimonadaceae bacterium]|nr:lipid A deacylase LpxR family protein [Gemmatimonadaceae bacterium]